MARVKLLVIAALIAGVVAAATVGASWKWAGAAGKVGKTTPHNVAGWSWGSR
jgi:hypothetical protein